MTGAIKPQLRHTAPAHILAEARANCAARLRARGYADEAEQFERGHRDDAWAMVHEVARLQCMMGLAA